MSEEMNQLKVAVILSGCGVYDGSEAYETVLTLLRLDEMGVPVSCFAPNDKQLHVINHLSWDENTNEKRSILQESARLVRGEISDISEASVEAFDAVIVPSISCINSTSFIPVSSSNSLKAAVKSFSPLFTPP